MYVILHFYENIFHDLDFLVFFFPDTSKKSIFQLSTLLKFLYFIKACISFSNKFGISPKIAKLNLKRIMVSLTNTMAFTKL